ncbi:hypothetical protein V8E36_001882 [Tilletia maclaganii]
MSSPAHWLGTGGGPHRRLRAGTSSAQTSAALQTLSRAATSAIAQTRSGHVALNAYLHRFGHVESPLCSLCKVPETTHHLMMTCRRYILERQIFRNHLRSKGLPTAQLPHHLSPAAMQDAARFLLTTGRFCTAYSSPWSSIPS